MKLTEYTIKRKTTTWMVIVLLTLGGIISFNGLGRLEDPNFTIKQAVIITQYPGASALEVEEEITLPIENAIQQLPYVKKIVSNSSSGLSQIEVEMKSIYRKNDLAQIWDEMRRKINDMENSLPAGAYPPIVNDDFADVYGVFYAITGEGFSYEELANYTDLLRRELILVDGVSKVNVGGKRKEQIFIEVDRSKMKASGIPESTIRGILDGQNKVSDAGNINIGSQRLRISSELPVEDSITTLGALLLGNSNGQLTYLSDIAKISKGYQDPAFHLYRFNGQDALTLGISFAEGVNVVEIGSNIQKRLQALEYARPIGIELSPIYNQPQQVDKSVKSFLVGLAQAVIIVVVVLMFTMGWRPGLIMSAVLLLTIAGTFIVMNIYDIELHRISLGALIIALGMLVDNAIVVTEGIMINIQRGYSRLESAIRIVTHNRWPLLGATVIAITAFAPIGLSPDASGEFTGSLFWVLFISLLLSWVFAVTLTPFFCYLLFKDPDTHNKDAARETKEPYQGVIYQLYLTLLDLSLRHRWKTMSLMAALLVSAIFAFGGVKQAFFPDSSSPIFMVDYWLPEGTSIEATASDVQAFEGEVLTLPGVKQVTTTIGAGATRFMLTYAPERNYPSYAQLLIEVNEFEQVNPTISSVEKLLRSTYPQAFTRIKRITVGPTTAAKIEARLIGPDEAVLRSLAEQVLAIFNSEPTAKNVRQDWRERAKVINPIIDPGAARRFGIHQADVDRAIKTTFEGRQVGTFREGTKVLPIFARSPYQERNNIEQLEQIQIYSPVTNSYISISQIMLDQDISWADPIIKRQDRKRTLSVLADPIASSNPVALLAAIRAETEAIKLPQGYSLEWGGEYEAQQDANKAVFAFLPLGLLLMVIITMVMFDSMRQTLVIWITVPLAIIGVAYGLLLSGSPFSFTALLAVLSLIGMQIKNGIVLVEEIKRLLEEEKSSLHKAIHLASVSRLRPVTMAALTTILGMIPLLSDVFFSPMAVTIMAGLGFASILTLIVVPVLFSLFYAGTSKDSKNTG